MKENLEKNFEGSSVKISNDVIAIIAGVAASEVEGLVGMSSTGFTGGLSEMLGMKNLSKGIRVEVEKDEVTIDIAITVEYGVKLSEVGRKVQKSVKDGVENMTGLKVVAVNVNIQDVSFPKENVEKDTN